MEYIWTCIFTLVYSLAGELLFFKIVKMNLNKRRFPLDETKLYLTIS